MFIMYVDFLGAGCSYGGLVEMKGIFVFYIFYLCLDRLTGYLVLWYSSALLYMYVGYDLEFSQYFGIIIMNLG